MMTVEHHLAKPEEPLAAWAYVTPYSFSAQKRNYLHEQASPTKDIYFEAPSFLCSVSSKSSVSSIEYITPLSRCSNCPSFQRPIQHSEDESSDCSDIYDIKRRIIEEFESSDGEDVCVEYRDIDNEYGKGWFEQVNGDLSMGLVQLFDEEDGDSPRDEDKQPCSSDDETQETDPSVEFPDYSDGDEEAIDSPDHKFELTQVIPLEVPMPSVRPVMVDRGSSPIIIEDLKFQQFITFHSAS